MDWLLPAIPAVESDWRDLRATRRVVHQAIDPGAPGDSELVHPDVLDAGTSWNGYRYWMAVTPYANADNQYENPCILASNDAYTWVVPAGLTNPIAGPPGGGYYSDVDLHLTADRAKLRCTLRHRGALASPNRDQWLMSESADGVTWSEPTVLLTNLSDEEEVSASFLLVDGTWRMYYAYSPGQAIRLRTTTDETLASGWTEPVTVFSGPFANGNVPWHMDAIYTNDEFWLLVNGRLPAGTQQDLWLLHSADGLTWTVGDTPVLAVSSGTWDAQLYRGTIWPRWVGPNLNLGMYYGSNGGSSGWQIARADLYDSQLRAAAAAQVIASVMTGEYPALIADGFDRTDATSLGSAITGQAWTVSAGAWSITGGQAHPTTDANSRSVIEADESDVVVRATLAAISNSAWLLVRYSSGSNYVRVGHAGTTLQLQSIESGSVVVNNSLGAGLSAGDVLEVAMRGDAIKVYVNGSLRASKTVAFNETATQFGMQSDRSATRFDDFSVRVL